MKYQKSKIKKIVLSLVVTGFVVSVLGGCATENRLDYPFERAQVRAKEKAEDKPDAERKYRKDVEVTDGDIVGFTAELVEILGKQEKNYRIIRKVSTTLGVLAGTIATSIHGAIGADADTVTMFSGGAVLTSLLQQIWGAGEASQAKRRGINLISDAQSRYYDNISTGNNGGKVDNNKITPSGATLYKEVMAALTVVGNAIAKQIPSLKDLQTAEGMNALGMLANGFALKINPRSISMAPGATRYINIVGDFAATADSVNPGIADVSKFKPGSKQIEVTANATTTTTTKGVTRINLSNAKGEKAAVFVKVGNRPPVLVVNAGVVANAEGVTSVKTGDKVYLNGSQSYDEDGDTLKYFWNLETPKTPKNSAAKLDDNISKTPVFIADVPGTYTAILTVNDGTKTEKKEIKITAE